jgi:hypothetical protein
LIELLRELQLDSNPNQIDYSALTSFLTFPDGDGTH